MKDVITWVCETCDDHPIFDHDGFIEHAQTVHGLAKDGKGNQSMMMHADGRRSYSTTYRWKFDNFSAQQKIVSQRTGEDAAYWDMDGQP